MLTINSADLVAIEAALDAPADVDAMAKARKAIASVREFQADAATIEAARDTWAMGSDDEIEIDDEASTSPSDAGTWVSAWVWMQAPEEEDDDDDDQPDLPDVPADYPVQPIEFQSAEYHDARARDALAQCGTCNRLWDDNAVTEMTPTPSGRCPFEAFHAEEA